MRAMRGMSKADTLRLVEIEHYSKTGTRLDGLHVTDEWVDESIKFLAKELRPTIEAWGEAADEQEREAMVAMAARKAHRLWKRGGDPEKLTAAMVALGEAIQSTKPAS